MDFASLSRRQYLGLAAAACANIAARAQSEGSASGRLFSRGVNFHHVLNWPALDRESEDIRYVWPPFAEDKYKLRHEDLALVRTLGFDFVRLTVDPGLFIAEAPAYGDELERLYLEKVKVILAQGLGVVFDLAPVNNHPRYAPINYCLRENAELFAAYVAAATRLAKMLSPLAEKRVALELFSEPPMNGGAGEEDWASMQTVLFARARTTAPNLTLVLTAAFYGGFDALTRLDVSSFDCNCIYTFHYYEPHEFTHQGMKTGAISYFSGLDWPLSEAGLQGAQFAAERAIAEDARLDGDARARLQEQARDILTKSIKNEHDEQTIARDFDAVAAWARASGVPPERVLLGEFGCVFASYGHPIGDSRLHWLAKVRQAAEARGFGWTYWAFKGYGGMELIDAQAQLHADLVAPLGLSASK